MRTVSFYLMRSPNVIEPTTYYSTLSFEAFLTALALLEMHQRGYDHKNQDGQNYRRTYHRIYFILSDYHS